MSSEMRRGNRESQSEEKVGKKETRRVLRGELGQR